MSEEKEPKSTESPLGRLLSNIPKPLRQPNCSGEQVSVSSSDDKDGNEPEDVEQKNIINKMDGKVLTSNLNADAAEFIPYSQMNQQQTNSEDIHIYLSHELQYLAITPGNYNEILESVYELLCSYQEYDQVNQEEVVKSVINTILDECTTEQNLCYSGVRLCTDLHKMFGNKFREMLLTCCQEKYINFVLNQDVTLDRMCGFGMVLAELYLQIDIKETPITAVGRALFELLGILLANEGEKAIKCACQILKLTGVLLEENDDNSVEEMDKLFSRMRAITTQYEDMDPNLRFTINNVIRMRDSNWGRNKSQQSSSVDEAVNSNGYVEIVFHGPDGEVITDEEKKFLSENLPSSDDVDYCSEEQEAMDEEMYKDYEKFLKLKEEAENKG